MVARVLTRTARSSLVLYVDKKVIVISKPPGVVSQATAAPRSPNATTESLDGVLDDLVRMLQLDSRPLSVHRLDKGTTGALLLARTADAARELSRQFAARTAVRKTYLALVRAGRETFPAAAGEVAVRLERADGRVAVCAAGRHGGGTETHTGWELLGSSTAAPVSLLRLTLHTGFKHQLRIHLASVLRAPILGDTLYSRTTVSDKIRTAVSIPEQRLFLHASHISFLRYQKMAPKLFRVGVTAPPPEDFVGVCTQLGLKLPAREAERGVMIDGTSVPCWHPP